MDDHVRYWLEMAEVRAYTDIQTATAAIDANPVGADFDLHEDVVTFWLAALDVGFFNRCIGLGIAQPATEAALDRGLEAFRAAGRQVFTVQVSPFARPPQLEAWLVDRSLRPGQRWAKLWRRTTDTPPERTDLRIERIGADRRPDFEAVVLGAFGLPETVRATVSATLGLDGWHHYLSFDGERAVGAGAMRVSEGVAWLGYGSTLASHRGRGSQSAILARRLRDAAALGASLAVTETGEDLPDHPNPSLHNMVRAGFEVGYLRRNYVSPRPAGSS